MKKFLFLFIIFLFSLFSLSGCGIFEGEKDDESADTPELSVIYGYHANAMVMNISQSEIIKEEFSNIAKNKGHVIFLNCDGSPAMYYERKFEEINSIRDEKIETDKRVEELLGFLMEKEKCRASHDEVDTLAAIEEAAIALSLANGSKTLLIADSGLATDGYLKFTTEGEENQTGKVDLLYETEDWDAYCQGVIKGLKDAEALPDLEGVSVLWLYMGKVGKPQEELSNRQENRLKELWTSILNAAGAESIKIIPANSTNEVYEDDNLPTVSIVPVEGSTIFPPKEFDESSAISFKVDSAEFKYPEKAKAAIKEVADELKNEDYSKCKICIIGTTAGCKNKEKYTALAVERAEKVKSVLIEEYGIDENRMATYGYAGDDAPNGWYQDDLDENGKKIEDIASGNRAVHIVDANSEEAHNLT